MTEKPNILPDISAMIAKAVAEALAQERAKPKGVKVDWAKDAQGKAVIVTWPGKRGRYLEVGEVKAILSDNETREAIITFCGFDK